MKKIFSVFVIAAFASACNQDGGTIEVKADTLESKLDTLGKKIGEKAEQVWDSTKVEATELKNKAEQKWDSIKIRHNDNDTIKKK